MCYLLYKLKISQNFPSYFRCIVNIFSLSSTKKKKLDSLLENWNLFYWPTAFNEFCSPNFFLLHRSVSYICIPRLFINNTLHVETFLCFAYATPQLLSTVKLLEFYWQESNSHYPIWRKMPVSSDLCHL